MRMTMRTQQRWSPRSPLKEYQLGSPVCDEMEGAQINTGDDDLEADESNYDEEGDDGAKFKDESGGYFFA